MTSLSTIGEYPKGRKGLIELRNVSKRFPSSALRGGDLPVVADLDLTLAEGELVTIFGPNGCGKTTILNVLAGILPPDAGVVINQARLTSVPSIGYVFQNHADTLLPWRTVESNIAFPLEIRGIRPGERADRIKKRLDQFHLTEHASKYVYQLSGGLKQLVAIARATVYEPQLLLLDEPFSALDYSLSRLLWLRFREFWTHQNVTTAFVSHNVDEAVFLGDRVIVLSARPARVVAEVIVPLGNDRSLSMLSSAEFFETRSRVLQAFEAGKPA